MHAFHDHHHPSVLMNAAYNIFITIPELVACLTPFISRHDIIQLIRINRTFNTVCTPLFWHTLDLEDSNLLSRLLVSPHGLRALGNHAHLICSVAWRPNFSWYYFRALWVYLNTTTPLPPEHQVISTAVLAHRQWGNLEYSPSSFLVPLPPLLGLSRLKACMFSHAEDELEGVPTYNLDNHLHQIMWLTRLNGATLTHLDVSQLSLTCARVVKDICWTISQLPCLRFLHLQSQPGHFLSRYSLQSLFYSCPTSLVDLKVDYLGVANQSSGEVSRYSQHPIVGDWDYDQGPLVLRDAPLLYLKSFIISDTPAQDLEQVFATLVSQCPALESLELPKLGILSDDMLFAIASIGELCPRISTLSFPEGCLTEHVMMVLEGLPEQQLRNLCYRFYNDPDPESMITTWTRHSTTLRRIEFTHATCIQSSVIQAALATCEGLEVFNATNRGGPQRICLIFANAIESEWVCKGIRELVIGVWVTRSGNNPEYMKDQSKATWTDVNHRHWEDLGKFYSKIGALTRLEILDLRSIGDSEMLGNDNAQRQYLPPLNETCFPGLLALEDMDHGKIGYLSKLAGLTHLRELRGSFVWSQRDNLEMIGEREVDWFVNHLPGLEMANFGWITFNTPLQKLALRRPRLRVIDGCKSRNFCK